MPRKTRKKRRFCKTCKTRFTGQYCPYCGAEYGHKHLLRSGGFFFGFLRFLLSLLLLGLILIIAFIALDFIASADDGAHTTAIAIVSSIKNALPERVVQVYTAYKTNYLNGLFFEIFKLS